MGDIEYAAEMAARNMGISVQELLDALTKMTEAAEAQNSALQELTTVNIEMLRKPKVYYPKSKSKYHK